MGQIRGYDVPRRVPSHHSFPPLPRRVRDRDYDQARDPDLTRFYKSRQWQRVRAVKLAEEPLCRRCKARGQVKPATMVHHTKPVREAMDDALLLDALEPLCFACHNREHKGQR
jgi:5-methylcytosine-specific restriction endonuclease McrA